VGAEKRILARRTQNKFKNFGGAGGSNEEKGGELSNSDKVKNQGPRSKKNTDSKGGKGLFLGCRRVTISSKRAPVKKEGGL